MSKPKQNVKPVFHLFDETVPAADPALKIEKPASPPEPVLVETLKPAEVVLDDTAWRALGSWHFRCVTASATAPLFVTREVYEADAMLQHPDYVPVLADGTPIVLATQREYAGLMATTIPIVPAGRRLKR